MKQDTDDMQAHGGHMGSSVYCLLERSEQSWRTSGCKQARRGCRSGRVCCCLLPHSCFSSPLGLMLIDPGCTAQQPCGPGPLRALVSSSRLWGKPGTCPVGCWDDQRDKAQTGLTRPGTQQGSKVVAVPSCCRNKEMEAQRV